jgi:hypothetical protein
MTPNKITQPKSTFTHAATHKVITRNSSNPIPAPATKIQTHIRGNTLPYPFFKPLKNCRLEGNTLSSFSVVCRVSLRNRFTIEAS